MDEFSTSRPQNLAYEGGRGWTIGVALVVLLLVIALIGLGSTGGTVDGEAQDPAATAPAPVISE